MSGWTAQPAVRTAVGDRVRLPNGHELSVTRVDSGHLGLPQYVKLVEDTEERWMCFVLLGDREVEVLRAQ